MSGFKIEFFAWCKDGDHDKVWGWATIGDDQTLYNFYGRRGKTFMFKRYRHRWELEDKSREKTSEGRKSGTYTEVPAKLIEVVAPGFRDEFQKQLAMAKLFDKFHRERKED